MTETRGRGRRWVITDAKGQAEGPSTCRRSAFEIVRFTGSSASPASSTSRGGTRTSGSRRPPPTGRAARLTGFDRLRGLPPSWRAAPFAVCRRPLFVEVPALGGGATHTRRNAGHWTRGARAGPRGGRRTVRTSNSATACPRRDGMRPLPCARRSSPRPRQPSGRLVRTGCGSAIGAGTAGRSGDGSLPSGRGHHGPGQRPRRERPRCRGWPPRGSPRRQPARRPRPATGSAGGALRSPKRSSAALTEGSSAAATRA